MPTQEPPVITGRVRFLYGIGAAAYGVKDNGFNYLLLLYYNQVLGLPASLAGLAIMIALAFDAISDPLVGTWSDNTTSRWGRRHPFMYASALPVSVAYFFLWAPPFDNPSHTTLFVFLTVISIVIRFLITLYEIPSTALVAELTEDYDERTRLLSMRYMFGWFGGLTMSALAWGFFLANSEAHPVGVLNRDGWRGYGWLAAFVIFASIMLSSLGLHRFIPMLNAAPAGRSRGVLETFKGVRVTFDNRNFLALFVATLFASVGAGISSNFNSYINLHFWGFTPQQIKFIPMSLFLSAIVAAVLAPRIAARLDKKRATMNIYAISILYGALPVVLRLLDLFPDNGHPWLLPIMVFHAATEIVLLIMFGILNSSMLADVVEHSEASTGRREEGLFFAARTFAHKVASSAGVFVAGIALELISFPSGAEPGSVPDDVIFNMGVIFGPLLMIFYGFAWRSLSYYEITRAGHDERVEAARDSAA